MSVHKDSGSTSQKFYLKSSNSNGMVDAILDQAIKKSNVKNFIKNGIALPYENNTNQIENSLGLEQHLQQLKKSCSDLKRLIKLKEQQTIKCKDETSFTFDKSKKIKENRQSLQQKISQIQKNLDKVNLKRQAALHSSKTYQHILQRMKKDSITLQITKNQLQKCLQSVQKSHSLTLQKSYSMTEFSKLSCLGLRDAHSSHSQQQQTRLSQLQTMQKQSNKRLQSQYKLKNRQRQLDQIQQLAADDIQDGDLIKLKKIILVLLFYRAVVKSKLGKLKAMYQPYQEAFFRVRSCTSVKDHNSLKEEFFGFQNSFGEKTLWVKNLERQIVDRENQRKQLNKRLGEVKIQYMEIIEQLETKENMKPCLNKKQLSEKSLIHQLMFQRVSSWATLQAKKLNIQNHQNLQIQEIFKKIFQKVCPKKPAPTSEQPDCNQAPNQTNP